MEHIGTCVFCSVRLIFGRTLDGNLSSGQQTSAEMPTFDVAARLRQLGMMPAGKQESSGLDSGPWTDDNHPDEALGPLSIPALRPYRHPIDGAAQELHPIGTMLVPHAHNIVEDWSVERKNLSARHIDRWHTA
jgi:hypothetical protein